MSFYSKDSKVTLTFKEMEAIARTWEKKLELEEYPMILEFIPELYHKEMLRTAYVQWSDDAKAWNICLFKLADKRTVIHELGHIYLAKILNNWYFVDYSNKSPSVVKKLNPEISLFFNRLTDCFNDYNLCKFEEFYKAYKAHVVVGLNQYPDPKHNTLRDSIRYYLKAYIDFNYILRPIDRENFLEDIVANLRAVKNSVILKTKSKKKKLSFSRFIYLDQQLDKFNIIKDSLESKTLLQFFYDILSLLGFWSKQELKKNFKWYFNYEHLHNNTSI